MKPAGDIYLKFIDSPAACEIIGHYWNHHPHYAKRTCGRCGLVHVRGYYNEWGTEEYHKMVAKYFIVNDFK